MAGRSVTRTVVVSDHAGHSAVLAPGDEVPEWATDLVTNPKAFEDDGSPSEAPAFPAVTGGEPSPEAEAPEPEKSEAPRRRPAARKAEADDA